MSPTDRKIEDLEKQFDEAWQSGIRPHIFAYLQLVPQSSRAGLSEKLLDVDIKHRIRVGEQPSLQDYLSFYPQLAAEVISSALKRQVNPASALNVSGTSGPKMASSPSLDDLNLFSAFKQSEMEPGETQELPGNKASIIESDRFSRSPMIGNYKLLQKLGEGGMGIVWMAEQEIPIRRRVALKLIKSGLDNKQVIARFEAERQALAMMDHQNIAKVLDAGSTVDGQPYFVMELVQGIPFNKYCDANKLPINERLQLFVPICKAVQHAHQKGVIHRDLKPSNVLVCLHDGKPIPKIIDFGLAKALQHQARLTDRTLFTEFGQVVGTLQYMSPEQAEMNQLDVDTRTDVYSLGVILYELLTGTTPIEAETLKKHAIFDVLSAIREKDPPRPSARISSSSIDAVNGVSQQRSIDPSRLKSLIRGELDLIVMKALEKDRTQRYDTASAFADDIGNFLNGDVVHARPPSTSYRLRKFIRKHKGLVTSLAVIAGCLLVGVIATTWFAIEANLARKTSDEKKVEAIRERDRANKQEKLAIENAKQSEKEQQRAIQAERLAASEKQRALELLELNEAALARTNYFLAVARWDADRAREAKQFLSKIPSKYRNLEWSIADRMFAGGYLTLQGHKRPILCLAFSPDGNSIVTGSWDNTLKLWDASTGREIRTLRGHLDAVECVKSSPDGTQILSGSWDGTVRIWNTDTGQEVGVIANPTPRFRGAHSRVHCIDVAQDGTKIATATFGGTLRIWDAESRELVHTLQLGEEHDSTKDTAQMHSFAFSPDGTKLVSCGWYNPPYGEVKVWDSETGKEIADLKAQALEFAEHAEFSPDGMAIIAGGSSQIAIWDATTFKQKELVERKWAGAQSPEGALMVIHGTENTLNVFDSASSSIVLDLKAHTDLVECVSFSPDGGRIATGSRDNTVRIWSLCDACKKSNVPLTTIVDEEFATCASLSPDGLRIASGNPWGLIRIWNEFGDATKTLQASTEEVKCVTYGANGSQLAAGTVNGEIYLWNLETERQTVKLSGHNRVINCLAFSPDGKTIASGSDDTTVRLWSTEDGHEIAKLTGHERVIATVIFTPDGTKLITGDHECLRVWDANTGKELLNEQRISSTCLAYTTDQQKLVVGGHEGITFLNTKDFSLASTLKIRELNPTSIAINAEGTRLITGEYGRMRIWDAMTGEEIQNMKFVGEAEHAVSFTPNFEGLMVVGNGVIRQLSFGENSLNRERKAKSTPNPGWHLKMATESEQAGNHYAATFHWAWVMKASREIGKSTEPQFIVAPNMLRAAFKRFEEQLTKRVEENRSKSNAADFLHPIARLELESLTKP